MTRRILPLILAAVCSATAFGDSPKPWPDQRVVSPNGKYYVVIKRSGGPKVYGEWGPVEFEFVQCAAGTPPVKAAESDVVTHWDQYDDDLGQLYEIKSNPDVSIRKGDCILGRGKLKRPPAAILAADSGLGFAGISVHGHNYHDRKADHALIIVSSTGKILHRKRMLDLYTNDELDDFDATAGSTWWVDRRDPGWINDVKQEIVLVGASSDAKPDTFMIRVIDWNSGKITRGPTQHSQKGVLDFKREHLAK